MAKIASVGGESSMILESGADARSVDSLRALLERLGSSELTLGEAKSLRGELCRFLDSSGGPRGAGRFGAEGRDSGR